MKKVKSLNLITLNFLVNCDSDSLLAYTPHEDFIILIKAILIHSFLQTLKVIKDIICGLSSFAVLPFLHPVAFSEFLLVLYYCGVAHK